MPAQATEKKPTDPVNAAIAGALFGLIPAGLLYDRDQPLGANLKFIVTMVGGGAVMGVVLSRR